MNVVALRPTFAYCSKCGKRKSIIEFYMSRSGRRDARCKYCANKASKEYQQKNWKTIGARKRKRGMELQPSGLTFNQQNHVRRSYGLEPKQFSELLAAQGYKCASCGGPFKGKRPMHVDHDHITGKIRGIVCLGCNLILGHAKDSVEHLEKVIGYLKRQGSR